MNLSSGGILIKPWKAFEMHAEEYDAWYEKYKPAYESELLALKTFTPENPENLKALEVGAGTGRFAASLGLSYGLEPARAMAEIAEKRGIQMVLGVAETLPFKRQSFDLVLIVASLSLFKDPVQALREAAGVLKPGGQIVIGILDRDSLHGDFYESRKKEGRFSSEAKFFSAAEVSGWLTGLGFKEIKICQTLYMQPEKIEHIELPQKGSGTGSFAVISARI
ncbi:class I SAM-dependent methyltransferase [Methanosarcina mazei]|uniref:Ubiquinone/menaquinone biosynthesis methyltransferase n=6 Tax=Methanosarcina mazei TaxID=2209 RepID=A0A0E3PWV6_METMZ|nr:class I SAM-dependent methyltransferase [Methanosarcina mazei]AAM29758.1 SAM-dependent methyltransferases [Methanosarcina mazei Go1]AKB40230.1 ubiquinone/menaquinone biosynthesis methyltransferase [Methanosarcina mazei WWM610]AKB61150.1 ubiquinone/menaquinone biosynthesis methyltransferase [Methanosarcina mazei SarPi]AKB64462.1 ubiquinone/menaquinone biosynthesis methyltransferase [Methanosarcina mazei S-6]AKB67794.1 ubiquinone/menaquinone biosynthesis methyltransferase [Methanosarcina maze